MRRIRRSSLVASSLVLSWWVCPVFAAQVWVVGVLEQTTGKYSRCDAISEDGQWVVGRSYKSSMAWPFYWSKTTGIQDMGNPGGSGVGDPMACTTHWDGSLIACGNLGGQGRKWIEGSWSFLSPNPGSTRRVYAVTEDTATEQLWIVGSSYPAENEKAYRSDGSSYIDYWGYYQDGYGVAHNGRAVGKNNWGNGYGADGSQAAYDWRYEHPIFIFDWTQNCGGGGNCGWDQLNRFASYGDENYYKGRATAIGVNAHWAVGYMTYDPANLAVYHAFKWQVPANPQPVPQPWLSWPRPIDLGTLGAGDTQSYAYCVSDSASNPVTGGTSYGTFKYNGYKAVYWNNSGCHDLYAELQGLGVDMTGWTCLFRIWGISANGNLMVGSGLYDDDNDSGTPSIEMGFFVDLVSTTPQPPIITMQPASQIGCTGGNVTFTVAATGAGYLSYQWQKNDVDLANGGHYAGVLTPTLTIAAADASDLANYRCVVSNADGTTNSSEATLTLASAAPGTPADGTPTANATDRITWRWSDVANESGYHVKDASGSSKSGDLAANLVQWQENALAANTSYTRTVSAFNACGESSPSTGQTKYTLVQAPTYGSATGSPTVSCDKSTSASGLPLSSNVTFTATNGFGDGANKVGQFGYLWDTAPGNPSSWTGEQFWTSGTLVKQVSASAGSNRYLHLRAYNNASPKVVNSTVLNLGPYTAGGVGSTCILNPDFESGFTGNVANNWTSYTYPGACSPTFAAGTISHGSPGSHSQQVTVGSGCEGGIYQRFDVTPGQYYTISVYFKCSVLNKVSVYIGIDPYGGTNPANATWSGGTISTDFVQTALTNVQAQSGTMTLYFDVWGEAGTGSAWIDDVGPPCSSLPAVPFDGTPAALSTTSIRWVWSDVANETGYRVKTTGGTAVSSDLAANTTQWDETAGLSANAQYTRKIHAFNAAGESAGSAGQSRYTLIQVPTGVAFGAVTVSSIVASPAGTLSNLTVGSSGVRTTNSTAGTNSGWQTSQGAWTSTGLAPNTHYTFVARARNGDGAETADSSAAAAWTLSSPPVASSLTPSDSTPCLSESVVWTAVDGFGAGKVQYYRYAWDQDPNHVWTGTETQWSSGTIATTPNAGGTWYLHVKGYNAADAENGSYDYPVTVAATVAADFNGDCSVDQADFDAFVPCVTGPGVGYAGGLPAGCLMTADIHGFIPADFNQDGDVDQDDFGVFQRCYSGPGAAVEPNCAN